jgi:F-type H+-transporting ATPase subunit epsilon
MPDAKLTLRIVTPERVVYEQQVDSVVATAWDGEVGILPRHAPMIALLGIGEFRARIGDKYQYFAVQEGLLHVKDDVVTVLAPAAEAAEELDVEEAREAQLVHGGDALLLSTIPGDQERKRLLWAKTRNKVASKG